MSKRGGASEVNGFISLRSDAKKTGTVSKRKDEIAKGKVGDADRKKKDPDKELSRSTTEGRPRLGEEMKRIKVRETGRKDSKTSSVRTKPEGSSVKTTDSKHKETTSTVKSKSSTSSQDKSKHSSQEVRKPKSDSLLKTKEVSSSPYVSGKVSKQKVGPSSQIKRQSSLQSNSSQDSPYRKPSLNQKPQASRTSLQEKARKSSQLNEMPSKMKVSSSSKTATSKSSKPAESSRTKKSSSTTKSKTKRDRSIPRITEESEIVQKVRPFGEIPRSNTFTKDDGGFDSLTSDLSLSQSTEMQSLDNFGQRPEEAEGFDYEDDFEDYESDFEECTESEESSTKSEEEPEESSQSEKLDEDELGDGLKVQTLLSSVHPVPQEQPVKKSILKSNTETTRLKPETKDILSEKEKPTNVEEERKLDSGSYDLTSHADLRRKKQIQDIRAAMDKENATLSKPMGHQKTRSFAEDEGFVEVFGQESQSADVDVSESSMKGLINFAAARKQQIKQKATAKVRKRGAILMEMIRLDVMSFNLLDIPSVPYEVYMQCYGRSNTYQIHTQTNEDAISEEVQTEEVTSESKWTQHPVKYSSSKSPDDLLFIFSQEKLGVGGEPTLSEKQDWLPKLHVNSLRLHNFINNAGEMVLSILEEMEQEQKHKVNRVSKKVDFGFSESFTSLNIAKVDFLKNRPVSIVQFSESNSSHILTVHKPSNEPLTIIAESEGRCILCTWSIREPSCPLQTLVASNDVSAVCLHSHLVFAGLVDGAVCLWDLREQSAIHCRSFLKEPDWLLRSPTYISAGLEKDKRHLSSVVSIKILPESNPDDSAKTTVNHTPTQVASLDGDGLLVVWTVVETRSVAVNIDSGLAPWGRVRLVQSSQLRVVKAFPRSVQHMMQCTCLQVDGLKPSNLYIGSNAGQVVHCMQSSIRAKPQFYAASSEGNTSITCMDFSKCGHSLLMVGDSGGRVQIYRTVTESPILNIAASSAIPPPAVKSVQWSPSRPGLFFVLDATSSIHVWDLCAGDMNSQMSVQFSPRVISSVSLNPHLGSGMMAVAAEAGTVEIYNLKSEFADLPKKEFEELNNTFTRYIALL